MLEQALWAGLVSFARAGAPVRITSAALAVLPAREPKRKTSADQKRPYPFACELDAMPPDIMRRVAQAAIERHLPQYQFEVLKAAEESERLLLRNLVARIGNDGTLSGGSGNNPSPVVGVG